MFFIFKRLACVIKFQLRLFRDISLLNRPGCVEEVTCFLMSNKQQILEIVFCRQDRTPEFFIQLLDTGVIFVPAAKRLLSKSKHNDPDQLSESLKRKSVRFVLARRERLAELFGKCSSNQQRPSQTRRKVKAKPEQKLKAEVESALQKHE